tara:strand:+ start:1887 stop:3182 length:1296 start_codon:yes stop_codon:yes gene_type:complete
MSLEKYFRIGRDKLFPICRSITGSGITQTLNIIKKNFSKLKIKKIKTGSKVFDWKVPNQWEIKNAYIKDKNGNIIIDFKNNNLHLVGYSQPVNKILNFKELLNKLHSLPRQPDAIPYITSYYKKDWGFCLSHNHKKELVKRYNKNDKFHVYIKSSLKKGHLSYGELLLKGESQQEILISTYICHPSMANNELSGPIVSMNLIDYFKKKKNKKTLRFIFIPETIGSIVYLSKNLSKLQNKVCGGYNLTCIGDDRQHSCMLSKYGDSPSDEALIKAYKLNRIKYKKYSFLKRGSDERQFNSPGVDIPITSIFRTKYHEYPEYHTSLDKFGTVVTKKGLYGGFKIAKDSINILMNKIIPKNVILCEPQLGKRDLYPSLSTKNNLKFSLGQQILDFLQYANGKNDLYKISKKINLNLKKTKKIYQLLKDKKLILF